MSWAFAAKRLTFGVNHLKSWHAFIHKPALKQISRNLFYTTKQHTLKQISRNLFYTTKQHTTSNPIVAYWMLGTAALVFSIVVVGGVTRLTESGLSIVEWNLIKGIKPPTNEQEWQQEFQKYSQFPEYKMFISLTLVKIIK
jgi:hypothetical protein